MAVPVGLEDILEIVRKCAKRVETWLLIISVLCFAVVSDFLLDYRYWSNGVKVVAVTCLISFALAAFIALRWPISEVAREFMLVATLTLLFVIYEGAPTFLYGYPLASLIAGGLCEYRART